MKREQTREIAICGTILPAEWDKDGTVTSIGIEASDGEEYIVFLDKMGEELLSFVDHKVEATGAVKKIYGDLVLTVSTYSLIEDHDEEG